MLGEVAKPFLGGDAGLQLREQRSDRLEGVDLLRLPPAGAELDEAEHTGGGVAGHQRCGGHRGRAGCLVALQPAAQPTVDPVRAAHHRPALPLALGQHRFDVLGSQRGHRARGIGSPRPLGHRHRARGVVVVQEAGVHIELLDELREHRFADRACRGRRGLHQRGGDGGDHQVQAAWHGVLRYGRTFRLGADPTSRGRNTCGNGITHRPGDRDSAEKAATVSDRLPSPRRSGCQVWQSDTGRHRRGRRGPVPWARS